MITDLGNCHHRIHIFISLTYSHMFMSAPAFTRCLLLSNVTLAGGVLYAIALSGTVYAAEDNGPASACVAGGGKYLGDMKCQLANGSVVPVLAGAEAAKESAHAGTVAPRSPHSWALATTAIIFQANGDRHDLLAGGIVTAEGQERGQRLLSKWWDVSSRNELLGNLTWLQFEGHRSAFDALGRQVDAMSELQLRATEDAIAKDPQELHKMEVVRQNHRLLGEKGILAWDLIRYIALCRWGYLAGYLSAAEAWDHIMPAALRLQETFSSWQDMESDYLLGRQFWSAEQTQENGDRFRVIYDQFAHDPSSPWNVNPWKMDLGVAAPLPIVAK